MKPRTLRDEFAMAAMQEAINAYAGLLFEFGNKVGMKSHGSVAVIAYEYADAMLAEREKGGDAVTNESQPAKYGTIHSDTIEEKVSALQNPLSVSPYRWSESAQAWVTKDPKFLWNITHAPEFESHTG